MFIFNNLKTHKHARCLVTLGSGQVGSSEPQTDQSARGHQCAMKRVRFSEVAIEALFNVQDGIEKNLLRSYVSHWPMGGLKHSNAF